MKNYQISKIETSHDINEYKNNYITFFNQLDPRHWLISLNADKENHSKKENIISKLIFLAQKNNYYKNLANYETLKSLYKIEKNNF